MFKFMLLARVSALTLASRLRAAEVEAAKPKGAVLHADGTPVLMCDLKILHPYRIEPAGDFRRLIPV